MKETYAQIRRKSIQRWAEWLRGDSHVHGPAPLVSAEGPKEVDTEDMTYNELVYELFRSESIPLIGDPKNAFAAADDAGGLHVFARDAGFVHSGEAKWEWTERAVMSDIQEAGATFVPCDGFVQCNVRNVSVKGRNYVEAAIRALIKLNYLNAQPTITEA